MEEESLSDAVMTIVYDLVKGLAIVSLVMVVCLALGYVP